MRERINPNIITPSALSRPHWPFAGGATIGLLGLVELRRLWAAGPERILLQRWFVEEGSSPIGPGPELFLAAGELFRSAGPAEGQLPWLYLAGYERSPRRSELYFFSWALHWLVEQDPVAIILVDPPSQQLPNLTGHCRRWQDRGGLLYHWRGNPPSRLKGKVGPAGEYSRERSAQTKHNPLLHETYHQCTHRPAGAGRT